MSGHRPAGGGRAAAARPGRHRPTTWLRVTAAGHSGADVVAHSPTSAQQVWVHRPTLRDLRSAHLRLAAGHLVGVALLARPAAVQPAAARRGVGLLHPHPADRARWIRPRSMRRSGGGRSSSRRTSPISGGRTSGATAGCSIPSWPRRCRRSRTWPSSSDGGGCDGEPNAATTTRCSSPSPERGDGRPRRRCRATPRCSG